jgi:CTP synthase (UTP-ammonia lyase)
MKRGRGITEKILQFTLKEWQQSNMFFNRPGHIRPRTAQIHPVLKSRPNRPHPLFKGVVDTALENL